MLQDPLSILKKPGQGNVDVGGKRVLKVGCVNRGGGGWTIAMGYGL